MVDTSPNPSRFAYRADIDGLRAVAVIAVVLFHLGFVRLQGGFLGVDIFFVISGYLITSIIAPKLKAGSFSFGEFYLKRIRRLIPPALVTIVLTFLASAFILMPDDFLTMAKSAIAASFSVSNFLFFSEAGYWDAQSELKPLLHTWSLGVEEQFYLFWPIGIAILWKVAPKLSLGWVFAAITLFGVVLSEAILSRSPSAAFYLLPARGFEFAIGACFACVATSGMWRKFGGPLLRTFLAWGSFFILLATIWLYNGLTPFPGRYGFIPCAATAVLLLSGAGATPTLGMSWILNNPFMVWIGRLSYSLYLVHWPVVSLMRYKVGLDLNLKHQIIAIGLITVLTLVLYYGVEKRLSARAGQSAPTKAYNDADAQTQNGRFAIKTSMAALVVSAIFSHAFLSNGWTWRFENLSYTPDRIMMEKKRRFLNFPGSCVILQFPKGDNCRPDAPINILIFGNSHEPDAFNFFKAGYGNDPDIQFIRFEQLNKCNFKRINGKITAQGQREDCDDRLSKVLDPKIINQIDILIYSSNRAFAENKTGAAEILETIKMASSSMKILTVGGYINVNPGCGRLINQSGNSSTCVDPSYVKYSPLDDKLDALYQRFMTITDYYLDKAALLCGENIPSSCETETSSRVPFSYDQHHLSLEFADYAGQKFALENPDLLRDLAGLSAK